MNLNLPDAVDVHLKGISLASIGQPFVTLTGPQVGSDLR